VEFNTLKVVKWFPGISPATVFISTERAAVLPYAGKSPESPKNLRNSCMLMPRCFYSS